MVQDDKLVALAPITATESYTLYYTSATPTLTGLDAYTVTTQGVQTLTVSSANPLVLFDLIVSLEWDARADEQFLSQLQFDLLRASELLYVWTNGQAALGKVTVYHERERWLDAQVRIYATNRMRPNAAQGGITSDIITDPITFNVNDTLETIAIRRREKGYSFTGFPILDDDGMLAGILTSNDIRFSRSKRAAATDIMTTEIVTAKPGIVIGRKGVNVNALRSALEKMTGKKVHVDVDEVKRPELDAYLVAEGIAQQIERRISFRRAMKQAVQRALRFGAEGAMVTCSGRLFGAEMARTEQYREGRVSLHTLRADIDYGVTEARTTYGTVGVKVFIFHGEILKKDPVSADRPGA